MSLRRLGLWLEVILCLGWPAVWSAFGLAMTAHWIVTTVLWDADVPARSLLFTLYAVSTGLGIAGALTLLQTGFGTTATSFPLRLTRVGLVAGSAASLFIPGGDPLVADWHHDRFFFLCATVLPCLCFVHLAYLGRKALFNV